MRQQTVPACPTASRERAALAAERELERRAAAARTVLSACVELPRRAANDPVDPLRRLALRGGLTAVLGAALAVVFGWLALVAQVAERVMVQGAG